MKFKSALISTFLIVFSTLFALMLAEGMVRLFLPQDKMVTWLQMHPQGFMMNQQEGTAFQEYGDHTAFYSFTNNRLRASNVPKTDSTILVFGDSFTFGLLLNDYDTFLYRLNNDVSADKYSNYIFLNGGIGGAGLADFPAWLDEFGSNISPDKILYVMNIHDLERALSKNIYVLNNNQLIKSQRWEPRSFLNSLGQKNWYRWLQSKSELFNIFVKILWKQFYFIDLTDSFNSETSSVPIPASEDLYIDSSYSLDLGIQLVNKLNDWCLNNNCDFSITTTGYFPTATEESAHTVRLRDYLSSSSNTTQIPFKDISPCVSEKTGGDYNSITIPGDSHPNEKGAKFIAECMQMNPAF